MRVESVHNLYRTDPLGVRVIEWSTKESNGKKYHESKVYVIRLYSKDGVMEEYSNKRAVDVRA